MKTRITVVGAALLLTLGSAVAGSFIYGQGYDQPRNTAPSVEQPAATSQNVTPEMIALWKATAASSAYVAPRLPI